MSRRTLRNLPFSTDRQEQLSKNAPESDSGSRSIDTMTEAPDGIVQSLMLSRLNIASNLRADIEMLISELVEKMAEAKVAEMLLAQRKRNKQESGQLHPPNKSD